MARYSKSASGDVKAAMERRKAGTQERQQRQDREKQKASNRNRTLRGPRERQEGSEEVRLKTRRAG